MESNTIYSQEVISKVQACAEELNNIFKDTDKESVKKLATHHLDTTSYLKKEKNYPLEVALFMANQFIKAWKSKTQREVSSAPHPPAEIDTNQSMDENTFSKICCYQRDLLYEFSKDELFRQNAVIYLKVLQESANSAVECLVEGVKILSIDSQKPAPLGKYNIKAFWPLEEVEKEKKRKKQSGCLKALVGGPGADNHINVTLCKNAEFAKMHPNIYLGAIGKEQMPLKAECATVTEPVAQKTPTKNTLGDASANDADGPSNSFAMEREKEKILGKNLEKAAELVEQGKTEDALKILEIIMKNDQTCHSALKMRALILMNGNRTSDLILAATDLHTALKYCPNGSSIKKALVSLYQIMAKIFIDRGDRQGAVMCIKEAKKYGYTDAQHFLSQYSKWPGPKKKTK